MRNLRRAAAGNRGLTLVEVMAAMAVLVVALLGLLSSIGVAMTHQAEARMQEQALNAARHSIENLWAEPDFRRVYALYNADPDDDPAGPGTAPGDRFSVAGLTAPPGGAGGRLIFPEDTSGSGSTNLREYVVDADLGMPRDLNGDRVIDDQPRSSDYLLLPVRVQVRYVAPRGGVRTVELTTILSDRPAP